MLLDEAGHVVGHDCVVMVWRMRRVAVISQILCDVSDSVQIQETRNQQK